MAKDDVSKAARAAPLAPMIGKAQGLKVADVAGYAGGVRRVGGAPDSRGISISGKTPKGVIPAKAGTQGLS